VKSYGIAGKSKLINREILCGASHEAPAGQFSTVPKFKADGKKECPNGFSARDGNGLFRKGETPLP
jgi:hypothetical protein